MRLVLCPTGMHVFAFRLPVPLKAGSAESKKNIHLCALCDSAVNYYLFAILFGWTAEGCAGVYRLFRAGYNHR
jgi:hypothetical protein